MGITRVQHPDLPPPATGQDVPQHKVRCSSIRPCRGGMNIPGVNAPGLVAPSLHHSTFHRAWGVSCRATAQPAAKRPDLPAAGGCARLASVLLIMAFPPVNRPWRSLALAHLSAGVSAGHAPNAFLVSSIDRASDLSSAPYRSRSPTWPIQPAFHTDVLKSSCVSCAPTARASASSASPIITPTVRTRACAFAGIGRLVSAPPLPVWAACCHAAAGAVQNVG